MPLPLKVFGWICNCTFESVLPRPAVKYGLVFTAVVKPIKGGLYVFYLFETLLGLYQKFKTEREIEKSEHPTPNRGGRSRSQRQSESCAQTGNHHLAILDEPKVEECYDEDCETNLENGPHGGAGEHWVNEKADSIEKREKFDEPLLAGHGHAHGHGFSGHGHSHGGHGHSHGLDGIAMVGWMVILGDGLHNFADGLGKYMVIFGRDLWFLV